MNYDDALAARKPKSSTRIRSDIIDIKRKTQIVTFINNVVVEKDDSSLLANKMILLYEEKDSKKTPEEKEINITKDEKKEETVKESSIRRIDAFGDVKIFSDEFVGSGDTGYYEPSESIFVLEKNVIVNNGASIATGDKFIYNTITEKGHFVGQKEETSIKDHKPDKRVMIIIGDDINDSDKKNK